MKPKPLVALNHLTVAVAILTSPRCAYALTPARPSRELDPISAMSWGGEPVRRDQQGKSTIRMGGVYTALPKIASETVPHDETLMKGTEADQPSRLICSSVTTRSTFSVLLLMR